MKGPGNSPRKAQFAHYVVGIIDVLGQKTALQDLDDALFSNPKPRDLTPNEDQPLRRVLWLRNSLGESVQRHARPAKKRERYLNLETKEEKEQYARIMAMKFSIQQFSDTVLLFSPIANDSGICMRGVFATMTGFAYVMLMGLGAGIAMRGGIEVGWATEIDEHDIYGPVVSQAHYLESEVAGYPRVVLGPFLVTGLRNYLERPANNPVQKVNRELARLCLLLADTDCDGEEILDFLGAGSRKIADESDLGSHVKKGLEFAAAEQRNFAIQGKDKLAGRYSHLLNYYKRRAAIWDITV